MFTFDSLVNSFFPQICFNEDFKIKHHNLAVVSLRLSTQTPLLSSPRRASHFHLLHCFIVKSALIGIIFLALNTLLLFNFSTVWNTSQTISSTLRISQPLNCCTLTSVLFDWTKLRGSTYKRGNHARKRKKIASEYTKNVAL